VNKEKKLKNFYVELFFEDYIDNSDPESNSESKTAELEEVLTNQKFPSNLNIVIVVVFVVVVVVVGVVVIVVVFVVVVVVL